MKIYQVKRFEDYTLLDKDAEDDANAWLRKMSRKPGFKLIKVSSSDGSIVITYTTNRK